MSKRNEIENRFFMELRANENEENEETGILEGMPIVFEKKTDIGGVFSEIIRKDALKNTDLRDVPLLVNHDLNSIPVARSRRNNRNSSMLLTVDEQGLKIRAKLDIKTNERARELYSAVKRGDINGMSFMFTVDGEEWENEQSDYPARTITSIAKVYEVSAVTFPAYEQTEINARAMEIDSARGILEKMQNRCFGENTKEAEKLKMLIEIEMLKNRG